MADSDSGSPILLQTSLYLALRRLRREDRTVLVWADAVCIDQSDDSEKARQIHLLPQIFQSAQQVFAWLGEEEDDSSEAMRFLNKLGHWVLEFSGRTRGLDDSETSQCNRPELPQVGDAMWVAVGHLLKRSWFSRIWIVQEAVLAAKLVMECGPMTIPWEVLHAAAALCFMNGLWDPRIECPIADQKTQKNILQLGDLRAKSWKDGRFSACDCMFNLLQLFHQKDVTKPRDRLFALLGMAQDEREDGLQPTYEGSDEDIIINYGSVFVKQGYGLNLLCQARMAGRRKGLPSWMPDLTAAIYPKTITAWGERPGEVRPGIASDGFKASGNVSDLRNIKVDGKVLPLQGWVVDEISGIGEYTSSTDDVILFIEEIFNYVSRVHRLKSHREREEVRCRLPIGDTYNSATASWDPEEQVDGPEHKVGTRRDAYRRMLQYLDYRRNRSLEDEGTDIQEAGQADYTVSYAGLIRRQMWPYYQTVLEFVEGFQPASAVVCETKAGRVGIVPQTVRAATEKEPGDKIVVFQGAKVPYIIRESGSTPETYQAVGECYIDGIMHGELFSDGKQRSGLQLQEFRLE
ncbi:hypothetical protein BFW01_g2014 [Lasiodiplodia theobromae]|nr:hypothetical protein BFW01_g2014 [Lasiodiplodia theobromae]